MAIKNIKKYPVYFYFIAYFIPIFFFILLEVGLRIFHYGKSIEQWTAADPEFPNILALNYKIAERYFYNIKTIPNPAVDGFDKVKKENAFRIFVLGESSAAGYPYDPNAAFSKYIKQKLQLEYPDSKIEVINMAMSAINSYTLLDLTPGIIQHKPDLVLIYTGHNEFYGALGAASTESVGGFRHFVKFVLWADQFKTVELLRNFISKTIAFFSSKPDTTATLMERMVGNQIIPLHSPVYQAGMNQWEGNLRDILTIFKNSNIPVVMGTLVSNLKDQQPFVSIKEDSLPEAIEIYKLAQSEYKKGNFGEAKKLFIRAKDLDALRFRGTEEANKIIRDEGKEFKYPVIHLDSVFSANSENGIVGNNLMTDHLHPNYNGYRIMGQAFLSEMKVNGFLPNTKKSQISENEIDKLMDVHKPITSLDSTIASYRLLTLKTKWPFVPIEQSRMDKTLSVKLKDLTDSLAFRVYNDELNWGQAHFELAKNYLNKSEIRNFLNEMDAVIFNSPFLPDSYYATASFLINMGIINEAYPYLIKLHELRPDAYTNKWIGAYKLSQNENKEALHFLETSYNLKPKDPQLLYNLAGAYYLNNDSGNAYKIISECVSLNPRFPGALMMKNQLQRLIKR